MEAQLEVEVEWGDCDPAGIVFYPCYFRWLDAAACLKAGDAALGLPLLSAEAHFQAPCRAGDRLQITSRVIHTTEKTMMIEHVAAKGEDTVLVGREVRVWAERDAGARQGIRAAPIPAAVRRGLERVKTSGDELI